MITIGNMDKVSIDGAVFDFNGLSTDEKPEKNYGSYSILNGSSFMEMDTKKIKFYDQDSDKWV